MLRPLCLWVMVDLACHLQFFFLSWKEEQGIKGGWVLLRSFHHQTDGSQSLCVCACFPFVSKAGALSGGRGWAPAEAPLAFVSAPRQWGMGTRLETAGHFLHRDSMSHRPACYSFVEKTKRVNTIYCHCVPHQGQLKVFPLLEKRQY